MAESKDTLGRASGCTCSRGASGPTVESVVRLTRHMERLGLDSVQMPWHFTLPPARFGWGNRYLLDPLVVLPAMVAATTRIRIGLNSGLVPILHPFVWAQYLASLDTMSGGRTVAGLALGWWEEDFAVGGAKLSERGKRTDEGLEIICQLWRGEPIETAGRFWDAPGYRWTHDPRPGCRCGSAAARSRSSERPAMRRGSIRASVPRRDPDRPEGPGWTPPPSATGGRG